MLSWDRFGFDYQPRHINIYVSLVCLIKRILDVTSYPCIKRLEKSKRLKFSGAEIHIDKKYTVALD